MPIVMECAKLRAIVRDESLELLLHPESRLKQRKKPAKQEIHRLEQPPIELKLREKLKRKQMNLEQEILLRQTAEEERISLLRRFVSLQEEERRHISRELHDHCGQEIIALQLGMKRAVNIIETENQKEANACFQEVNEILSRLSGEIHDLAFDLRPPSLDELGLHTAICSLLELWSERVGITVDFECRN